MAPQLDFCACIMRSAHTHLSSKGETRRRRRPAFSMNGELSHFCESGFISGISLDAFLISDFGFLQECAKQPSFLLKFPESLRGVRGGVLHIATALSLESELSELVTVKQCSHLVGRDTRPSFGHKLLLPTDFIVLGRPSDFFATLTKDNQLQCSILLPFAPRDVCWRRWRCRVHSRFLQQFAQ